MELYLYFPVCALMSWTRKFTLYLLTVLLALSAIPANVYEDFAKNFVS